MNQFDLNQAPFTEPLKPAFSPVTQLDLFQLENASLNLLLNKLCEVGILKRTFNN